MGVYGYLCRMRAEPALAIMYSMSVTTLLGTGLAGPGRRRCPRLSSTHFWKTGDATALVRDLRTALAQLR
jgi:hypothetical protein